MKTNIESFGHTLEYIGEKGKETSAEVVAEKERLNDLLDQPNGTDSLREIRERLRVDFETLGYAALEVGRDSDGNVDFMYHIPAHSIRMTKHETVPTTVEIKIRRDGGKYKTKKVEKYFRRFVQIVGGRRVYFKEFGDPRSVSSTNGLEAEFQDKLYPKVKFYDRAGPHRKLIKEEAQQKSSVLLLPITGNEEKKKSRIEPDDEATEIIWISRYVSGEFYGLPRWINQLPSILGSRESELVNLMFFQDNAIPMLAILVAGGYLSEDTMNKIQETFDVKGRESMHRVIVLEADTDPSKNLIEGNSAAVPKLELKALGGERQQDQLFQEYDDKCSTKIRSSFRIAPLFIGLAEEYTKASAQAALETTDSQVFSPERSKFDDMMNTKVLLRDGEPPQYWKFRTNPTKIVNSEGVVNAMKTINQVGGMTPNVAIHLANELLDMHIPKIDKDWADMPFDLIKGLVTSGRLIPDGAETAGTIMEDAPATKTKPKMKPAKSKKEEVTRRERGPD
jgi:PBSX family phage portal protein